TGRDGRIKGRDVRLGRLVVFLMVFVSLCDVLAQFAMCTLAAFSRFTMEIAPRGLSAYES
ncbi:hypothetical protein, partial [Mesorhizobium sp.]|uniref:hypothetical protein n=1 Tax=Mesorhizobium sp. TaxID=1871066 RepID=UPI0025FF3FDB